VIPGGIHESAIAAWACPALVMQLTDSRVGLPRACDAAGAIAAWACPALVMQQAR
jgi:hypothetical protein